MHERLIEHIRANRDGVESTVLAEQVLKFKHPDKNLARAMISGILGQDKRCRLGDGGLWYPEAHDEKGEETGLTEVPWAAVHVLAGADGRGQDVMHVSVWSLFETPAVLASQWLIDPSSLTVEEREALRSPLDAEFDGAETAVRRIASILETRAAIFLSGRHQALLARECFRFDQVLPDDTTLASQLLKIAGIQLPRPFSLESCYGAVYEQHPVLGPAIRHGECFAECAWEALRRLVDQGVATRGSLDELQARRTLLDEWSGKAFSLEDIIGAPTSPGVYGFKNTAGEYIYIGKAKNLRRRLVSYFRATDEPSAKLVRLREQAHELTIHTCGSELESLIQEYRLIRKHTPALNIQTEVNERKGRFDPIADCVVLLPHAQAGKGMSVWLRRDQRALLKPFNADFSGSERLQEELSSFFFVDHLPPKSSDFAELEIVFRWVRQHENDLVTVPVHRLGSAQEVLEWMRSSWMEVCGQSLGSGG